MSYRFDATLKGIVAQHAEDFASVFGLPRTMVTALNVDLSTLSAATDVALGLGQPIAEIVDLNFQSGPDPALEARLYLYNAAFHLRYGVPVRSLAILLRPKADAANLTGKLVYGSDEYRLEFRYGLVRMWLRPVDPFLAGGVGLLPLATLCQMPEPLPAALRKVVREIDRRLARESDHAQAVRLMTAAFILTGMRVAKEDLASIYSGVQIMQESTAFDMAIEEGLEKGLEKGLKKGLKKGLEEGRLEEARRILFLLGEEQFNTPPRPKFQTMINAIQNLAELEQLTRKVVRAKTWEELFVGKAPSQSRRRKKE